MLGGGEGFINFKSDEREEFEDVATIEETIEKGEEVEVTHYNMSILRLLDDDIEYATTTIIDDYLSELKMISKDVEMTNEQFRRYKYRPDLFCYDIYGSKDLDFVLLAINGINDAREFDRKKIKFIAKDALFTILSYIINAEIEYMENNRDRYTESKFY